jgi:hypothetical protein
MLFSYWHALCLYSLNFILISYKKKATRAVYIAMPVIMKSYLRVQNHDALLRQTGRACSASGKIVNYLPALTNEK